MLKSFKEQEVDINKEISNIIDDVVDNWIKELLTKMIASPMDPSAKRSLWDRFKGSLANIWYRGKYNPQNPYYWKHRLGDELGATTENFNPLVFTLEEYNDLKSIIDGFEDTINEQDLPPGTEKLKLVQTIKSAGEDLKIKLKDVFLKKCSPPQPRSEPPVASSLETGTPKPPESTAVVKKPRGRPRKNVAESPKVKKIPVSAPPVDMGAPPSIDYKVGSEEKYKKWIPKNENEGKSLIDLKKENQYVDAILHPDYSLKDFYDSSDESVEAAADLKIKNLEKLKNDAEMVGEDQSIIDKINTAIIKMKKF